MLQYKTHTDMLHRKVELVNTPCKIISLVPSQSELLYDLGIENEVIGITKFCIHPTHWKNEKVIIGGTKNVNFEKIANLNPDLIIANKEENTNEEIQKLEALYPLWISDVNTFEDNDRMIELVGKIVNKEAAACKIRDDINKRFTLIKPLQKKLKVAYLIWRNPWMAIGNNNFINCIIEHLGFLNIFSNKERYPIISIEDFKKHTPDILFLSSEPFPFSQKHIEELQPFLPQTLIQLVDGEMFSWYGSRMLKAAEYLNELINQIPLTIRDNRC